MCIPTLNSYSYNFTRRLTLYCKVITSTSSGILLYILSFGICKSLNVVVTATFYYPLERANIGWCMLYQYAVVKHRG